MIRGGKIKEKAQPEELGRDEDWGWPPVRIGKPGQVKMVLGRYVSC